MKSVFLNEKKQAEPKTPQVLPRIDQKPLQLYETKKTLDTKKLVAQTLFGEANFDESEMRSIASVMANRAAREKADLNSVLAAKDKYGRFEFQGLNNAQAQKYLKGDLGGLNEKEKAALADRIADELVSGKFKPTTSDRFFAHSGGKLKTYDQEGRTIPGQTSNLDEFATISQQLPSFLRDVTPDKKTKTKKSFFDHIKSAAKSIGGFFAKQRQANRDDQAKVREYMRVQIASRGREKTEEEKRIVEDGKKAASRQANDLALGLSVGSNTAVKAVGDKIARELAAVKDAGVVQDILSKIGLKADDGAKVIDELVTTTNSRKVQGVIDSAITSGELKTMPIAQEVADSGKQLINVNRYDLPQEAKEKIVRTAESIRPELEAIKGKPITHEEVLKAAGDAEVLRGATSRAETLKREAQLLKLRQQVGALAGDGSTGVTREFVESLKTVSNEATSIARQLESLKNTAVPELDTNKTYLIREMLDLGVKVDDIVEAAKGVNFDNANEANEFFRRFIKPTVGQIIDEYRYINLLSSPRTHIVNAFSNLLQTTVLRPSTKLASGIVDMIGSTLSGKERSMYASEVPSFYKGAFNSVGDAVSGFLKAFRGETQIYRPDVESIPTGAKFLKPFQAIPRLLEASDVFFRTLITGAEKESLMTRALKQGKVVDEKLTMEVNEAATKKAKEYVFRKALDPMNKDGQGALLSTIDKFTSAIYSLRKFPSAKWFIPFVQTPMNILKMGIEYSPLGVATLPGATNKTEQIAKMLVGSTVFAGAGSLAMQGRTTWSAPRNQKERAAFYASGRKPYAVKIGDNWVSYSKLGPLAYPVALASAVAWYTKENPQAATDASEKKLLNILSGVGQFFADQSYIQGMSNLLESISGDPVAIKKMASSIPSQLVPLVSLQRWIAQIIDPVYRESGKDFSIKSVIQNIQKGIPVLSRMVPAELDPSGKPSRVQNRAVRALSPFDVGTVVPKYEKQLQLIRRQQRLNAIKKEKKTKRKLKSAF